MGGIELVAKMISKAHFEENQKNYVLSFGKKNLEYFGEFKEKVFQIKNHLSISSAPINLTFIFSFLTLFKKILPDLIYVHLPNPYMHLLISLFASTFRKINPKLKIYCVYHSDIVNQKRLKPFYEFYLKRSSGCYDKFIVACHKIWDNSPVLSTLPLDKRKIVHYCSEQSFIPTIRNDFKGNLVAIGRLVPYKGFDFLIKTINTTNYKLTIIGEGPQLKELQSISNHNIKLVGRVSEEEKIRILEQSDLLIVSSLNSSEAYGMIIVEAFAQGIPVLASKLSSCVTFLAKDGERSLNFEPQNSQQLISCLNMLEEDKKLIEKLSINCIKFHEEKLSFKAFKKSLLSHE